jgi:hypothetical protein
VADESKRRYMIARFGTKKAKGWNRGRWNRNGTGKVWCLARGQQRRLTSLNLHMVLIPSHLPPLIRHHRAVLSTFGSSAPNPPKKICITACVNHIPTITRGGKSVPHARESNSHEVEYSPRDVTFRIMYIGKRTRMGSTAEVRGDGMEGSPMRSKFQDP